MSHNDSTVTANDAPAAIAKRDTERYLVFSLNQEQYALPLLKVKEVIGFTEITQVPYTPSHFRGIMNLRGQVISVIDLRLKFRMTKAEISNETVIIILDLSPLSLGIIVDAVESVMAIEAHDIQPTPDIESQIRSDYILGVARKDKRLILLLDLMKALSVEELMAIRQQSGNKAA